jgi:hypothetical protein
LAENGKNNSNMVTLREPCGCADDILQEKAIGKKSRSL